MIDYMISVSLWLDAIPLAARWLVTAGVLATLLHMAALLIRRRHNIAALSFAFDRLALVLVVLVPTLQCLNPDWRLPLLIQPTDASTAELMVPLASPLGSTATTMANSLVAFWLLGVIALLLRQGLAERFVTAHLHHLATAGDSEAVAEAKGRIAVRLEHWRQQLLSGHAVRLRFDDCESPWCTVQWQIDGRPGMPRIRSDERVIVLPKSARTWAQPILDAALVHELVHLRRGDCWWLRGSNAITALLWPVAPIWAMRASLLQSTEETCDGAAATVLQDVDSYLDALVSVGRMSVHSRRSRNDTRRWQQAQVALAWLKPAAAGQPSLRQRVQRLLAGETSDPEPAPVFWSALCAVVCAVLVTGTQTSIETPIQPPMADWVAIAEVDGNGFSRVRYLPPVPPDLTRVRADHAVVVRPTLGLGAEPPAQARERRAAVARSKQALEVRGGGTPPNRNFLAAG